MPRFIYKTVYLFFVVLMACSGEPSENLILEEFQILDNPLLGGDTTTARQDSSAFEDFAPNFNFENGILFQQGDSFFERPWVTASASATARDGLGPFFNARACAACHVKDGRGAPPIDLNQEPLSLLIRLSIPGETETGAPLPEPNYGGQLQTRSIFDVDPSVAPKSEASLRISYIEIPGQFPDGEEYSLRMPEYNITENIAEYGALDPETLFSPRVAPQIIGMGLLEAIDKEDILALVDSDDLDEDGISGRANFVWDVESQTNKIGRFGWKANQPSVKQQVAGAFNGDIGITSSLFPEQNCSPTQIECLNSPDGGIPEIRNDFFDAVVFYSQTLAVPARRNWQDPEVKAGQELFGQLRCTHCHRPQFVTSADYPIPQLANQKIQPFTDLLLHDMGPGLSDHRPDFLASGHEWRTPPLWGIGLFQTVNRHTNYLHDGRARNLTEAILWHGGEAEESKNQFMNLSVVERNQLIQFLESL